MKKKIRRCRCKNCHDLYRPDPRSSKKQKFCNKPGCKKASKKHSQQKWLKKPKNKDYFSGSANVIRVQQWRQKNPGYWKRRNNKKDSSLIEDALQDMISVKTPINKGLSYDLKQSALQDFLSVKTIVFIGFNTQLNETALQDIIDITDQGAVKLVPDVLKKLIEQNKGCQNEQILFFSGTI